MRRFLSLLILLVLVIGAFLLGQESLNLARQPVSSALPASTKTVAPAFPPVLTLKTTVLDNTVTYQIEEGELESLVQRFPDYQSLPGTCSPVAPFWQHSTAQEQVYTAASSWDLDTLQTENSTKRDAFMALAQSLDQISSGSAIDPARFIDAEQSGMSPFLPWIDPDCQVDPAVFLPIWAEKLTLEGYEQAWYVETLQDPQVIDVPSRWLYLRSGSRWIVVQQIFSIAIETGLSDDAYVNQVEERCASKILASCLAEAWSDQWRRPERQPIWVADQVKRISF